jgi:hypothetical protein
LLNVVEKGCRVHGGWELNFRYRGFKQKFDEWCGWSSNGAKFFCR